MNQFEKSSEIIIVSNNDQKSSLSEQRSSLSEQRSDQNANDNSTRKTSNFMTKYEKARILGTRAVQISAGSHILVDYGSETDPLRIAQMELRSRKIPMIIRRVLPDGTQEDWSVSDMIID